MPKDPTSGIRIIVTVLLIVGFNLYFFHWEGIKTAFHMYMQAKGYKVCSSLYEIKHKSVENGRYNGKFSIEKPIDWGADKKSCLVYYRIAGKEGEDPKIEVWDYSNDILVLK